jgi:uncharacterized protein (DUF58 family)
MAVLAAFGISAVMGIDTEHNVEYQVFALVTFLLVVSVFFGFSFRGRFAANRTLPRFGTVGKPFKYHVSITNHTRRTQRGLTLIEGLAEAIPSFHEWYAVQLQNQKEVRSFRFEQRFRTNPFRSVRSGEAPLPPVAPGEETRVQMELTPLRRGILRFKSLVVGRADPLGLFRALIRLPLPQSMLVLPRRYPLPPLAMPGSIKYQEGGVAMASSVGQSDEFVSLRDYRHGDPLRHIHWRTWARLGRPVVKEFEDEFFVRHALVLDTFTKDGHSPVFEEAVSVAASFACTLQTQESLLDLLFVGPESYCFTTGRGLAHTDQMLEILAAVTACRNKPFNSLESLVIEHSDAVSGCVCVLISWDKARQEFVRKLRANGVPVLVLLVTPGGRKASRPDPGPMRDAADMFHVLEAGDIERGLARLK